jgi:hypothetical protein
MTMITNPQIGATITTHKGNIGIVEQLEDRRVIIRIPEGTRKSVPLSAIARWEMPQPIDRPMPEVGDRLWHFVHGQYVTVVLVENWKVLVSRNDGHQYWAFTSELREVPPPVPRPPVGAIAYGELGIGYAVRSVEGDRVVIQTPDGRTKAVSLSQICWWELNPNASLDLSKEVRVMRDPTDALAWTLQGDVKGCWYSSDSISKLLKQPPYSLVNS